MSKTVSLLKCHRRKLLEYKLGLIHFMKLFIWIPYVNFHILTWCIVIHNVM